MSIVNMVKVKRKADHVGTNRLVVGKARPEIIHEIICFGYLWNRTNGVIAALEALPFRPKS